MFVPHNRPTFCDLDGLAVADAAQSGFWSCGPVVVEFERRLAALAKRKHAICVASGLSALRLGLLGAGVGQGDEVIVPAYSCVALANAVLSLGATPVPVDVLDGEWNIDPAAVHDAITPRTKVIIAVHLFGVPARIRELKAFGITVIEDCAHAVGTDSPSGVLGGIGDLSVCSFYTTKLLSSAKGGAVLTNNDEVAQFVCDSRHYAGHLPSAILQNDVMTDIEAALGVSQLKRFTEMLERRRVLADQYLDSLSAIESAGNIRLPVLVDGRIWYRFVVELAGSDTGTFVDRMKQRGIGVATPVEKWNINSSLFTPMADRAHEGNVSIPLYPTLTDEEQRKVIDAMWGFFS